MIAILAKIAHLKPERAVIISAGACTPGFRGSAILLWILFIDVRMLVIFTYAFREGMGVYFSQITQPATLHAIWPTVLTAIVVVPINMVFGVCAAWLITR